MRTKVSAPRSKRPALIAKEARFHPIAAEASVHEGIPLPEPFDDLLRTYKLHPWVYACVFAICSRVAAVPLRILRETGKGREPWPDHPMASLMRSVNPYMTMMELMEYTCMSAELTGNAYWALETLGGSEPAEIWPLEPGKMKVLQSREKFVDRYVYDVDGREITYLPEEIVHFRYPSPISMHYGQGSVEAGKLPIAADLLSLAFNKNFFQNSARPDAMLMSKVPLRNEDRIRIRASWKKMHQGVQNSHKLALLEGDMEYKEIVRSHRDMEFVQLRKMNREEILSVFGVPPIIVGLLEHANYSNAKEQKRLFWENTLIPKLTKLADIMTMRFAQITGLMNAVVLPDFSGVEALREDELQRSQTARNYVEIGVPINQVIDRLGLPFEPVEGGDVPRQPVPQMALSFESGKKAAPEEVETKRLSAWRRWDAELGEFEEGFKTAMRRFFGGQRERQLARLRDRFQKQDVGIFLLEDDEEERRLYRYVNGRIRRTFAHFGRRAAASVNESVSFDLQNPRALDYIERKSLKLAADVNAATKADIKDAIEEGFSESETIDQIAKRINESFDFADKVRSERIARTEVISASNGGAMEGFRQTGVRKKEWLSARDEKVRDTHAALDRHEAVGLNESFISPSGARLKFPGDPDAPPEEIINCRCTILPITEG